MRLKQTGRTKHFCRGCPSRQIILLPSLLATNVPNPLGRRRRAAAAAANTTTPRRSGPGPLRPPPALIVGQRQWFPVVRAVAPDLLRRQLLRAGVGAEGLHYPTCDDRLLPPFQPLHYPLVLVGAVGAAIFSCARGNGLVRRTTSKFM